MKRKKVFRLLCLSIVISTLITSMSNHAVAAIISATVNKECDYNIIEEVVEDNDCKDIVDEIDNEKFCVIKDEYNTDRDNDIIEEELNNSTCEDDIDKVYDEEGITSETEYSIDVSDEEKVDEVKAKSINDDVVIEPNRKTFELPENEYNIINDNQNLSNYSFYTDEDAKYNTKKFVEYIKNNGGKISISMARVDSTTSIQYIDEYDGKEGDYLLFMESVDPQSSGGYEIYFVYDAKNLVNVSPIYFSNKIENIEVESVENSFNTTTYDINSKIVFKGNHGCIELIHNPNYHMDFISDETILQLIGGSFVIWDDFVEKCGKQ